MTPLGRLAALMLVVAGLVDVGGAAQQTTEPPAPSQGEPSTQQASQPEQTPQFRAGVNFVRVDAIVTDSKGNPVVDLKPGDFEVTEDGKPQTVETLKLIRLDGAMPDGQAAPAPIRSDFDEEREAARDDVRLFAIFFDDYHVRRGASFGVRTPLTRFIDTQLRPLDMVGVMYPLTPLSEVRMTRDRASTERAIEGFVGRKFDYTPRNLIEENYARYPAQTVEDIRNQVSLTAIKGLIIHMGSLKEGRKALILVSEGFTALLPPQLRNPDAQLGSFGNPAARDPLAGVNDPVEQSALFSARMTLESYLQDVWSAAARYNVAIYAVDPRGLAVSEFEIDQNVSVGADREYLAGAQDTLQALALNSDGRAIVNRNDLTPGLAQIVRDSSAYYLLGYSSSQAPSDGKFHEVKVRVKRPGVSIRARKGYWALEADAVKITAGPARNVPPAFEAALAASVPARGRAIRTWIGTSRGANGRTRVTFVWEPAPRAPGSVAEDEPARVSVTVAGEDGAPYFRGRVPEAPAAAGPGNGSAAGSTSGLSRGGSRVTFEAPPGHLQLRLSVEGRGAQVVDSETRDLVVPDLTSPDIAIGTPVVLRARTVREWQQLKADRESVPVAARDFIRTDRLLIRVPAYGPAGTTPALGARLLNRAGQPVADLSVVAGAAAEPEIDLPLASLPPGDYVVEVSAKGRAEAKQFVGFRIAT